MIKYKSLLAMCGQHFPTLGKSSYAIRPGMNFSFISQTSDINKRQVWSEGGHEGINEISIQGISIKVQE
jgi:hypothetical protein